MASPAVFRSFVFFLLRLQLLSATATATAVAAAPSLWKLKYLPGFSGPLPFELETGYVGVGDSEEIQLFYYFVKSQRNPQTDPLMTWYIGGPGCSALSGLFLEVGPINFKVELYDRGVPQLVLNPHAWTKKANILFIDAPVGTGFSYSKISSGYRKGDILQVEQNHEFLQKWLAMHPEFISNPFYVGGDSYSGMIIPPLTQAISEGNNHSFPPINLQGYIMGNPVTISKTIQNYRILYAYRLSLIPTDLYESLTISCKGEYVNVDPSNMECVKHLSTYEKCVSRISMKSILARKCEEVNMAPEDTFGSRRILHNTSKIDIFGLKVLPPPSLDCDEYKFYLLYHWANNDQVRKALHIRKRTIGEWFRCQRFKDYNHDFVNVVTYHLNLSSKGYRSLIFSGDHDMLVSLLDTEAWIKSLNYSIIDDWRPWFSLDDQVFGYTTTYANNMTFATIKGGGHTPQVKQYETSIMFNRWIDGKSL